MACNAIVKLAVGATVQFAALEVKLRDNTVSSDFGEYGLANLRTGRAFASSSVK